MSSTQQLLLAEGAGGVPVVPNYIEDVFSTYLYTGNGSTQTITNGIDLSTKGGLVWIKSRSGATNHALYDTARGATKDLFSNSTPAETTQTTGLTAFSGTGFSIGELAKLNTNADTYASWTFRKQPKFFDVVTFTKSTATLSVPHSLGSVPGCVIIKATNIADEWPVYHRGLTSSSNFVYLNRTYAQDTAGSSWITPTSTTIELSNRLIPADGNTYVAYLFAHDAGGFGLTGTDNVISCGSFTQSIGGFVNLGFEPQWVLTKRTSGVDDWRLFDNMRGMTMGDDSLLNPNLSAAENNSAGNDYLNPQPTGFTTIGFDSGTHIYIAIRRGPMKVPTSGTSVFRPMIIPINSASATTPINAGLTTDMVFGSHNSDESGSKWFASRLTANYRINSTSTAVEALGEYYWDNMVGVRQQETNAQPTWYFLKRAPSFFDEVCYTGTGSARTVTHNLQAVPELMIVKQRSSAGEDWLTYSSATGNTKYLYINGTASAQVDSRMWNDTTPTSSVFTVGTYGGVNSSGVTLVAYLFATCAGVSKVGSYTGTGTTKQIDCGFTGGARFVLIKKTSGTGSWYVWDSSRGIVSGNDPYLLLNSTAAEVTNTDYIDTYSAGFEISSTAPSEINENGGSFIFFAVS
jgi:hypothetical protein